MLAIHLFAFFHDKDSDLPNIPAEKENAIETQHFHSVLSTYSILVFVLFDFRYFLCRSSNDTQALVAHAVKQRIKLSPLRGFLGVITWKEKLVYRNVIPGNEVIENLQTRLLSFVLDIRKVTRGDKSSSLTFLRLSPYSFLAALMAAPKALKSYIGTGRFAIFIHPITFYSSPFLLDMST